MEKYDFIRCMNLHKKLKERIKGHIFISIDENRTLSVNIKGPHRLLYKCNIDDTSKSITEERLANEIEADYRSFVKEEFFVKKEVNNYV